LKVPTINFNRTYDSNLTLSNIGIGTYLGPLNELTDKNIENAVVESITSGCINVVDTALNYRHMRSERAVGRALAQIVEGGVPREEIFLSSKVGLVANDMETGVKGAEIIAFLKGKGAITDADVINGS
jgi:aryl-alcohol dehydrogenase-like predicted oxidoreductase